MTTNNIAAEAKLMMLQNMGFVFRVPGGSSRKGDSSQYAVIYRFREEKLEILIVPYNPSIFIKRDYPENEFSEEVEGALELKVIEQTGVRIMEYQILGTQEAKNNRKEVRAEKHIKTIFGTDTYDDSNIRIMASPDKRLDPPLWIEIELLKNYLCPQHQWMLELFIEKVLMPRMKEDQHLQ